MNNSSANINLSKTRLHRLLGTLLQTDLYLMRNVHNPLAKSNLIPLGLTAVASATDTTIQGKLLGSNMISSKEIDGIIKMIKSRQESGLLIKGIGKTIKNEVKEQKGGFLGMLLGTLGASWLGNLLKDKAIMRLGKGKTKADKGTIKAGEEWVKKL